MGRATRACSRAARTHRRSRSRRGPSPDARPARERAGQPGAHGRAATNSCSTERDTARSRRPRQGRRARRRSPPARPGAASEERPLQPAVDRDGLPRDVPGAVAGEKADDVAELARLAPAAPRDVGEVGIARAVRIEMLEARGPEAPRCDAIYRGAPGAEFSRARP